MLRTLALLLPAVLTAVGCASVDDSAGKADAACVGIGCQPVDAGRDQFTADVAVPDGATDAGGLPMINPLCGKGCDPDEAAACANFTPPASEAGAADAGDASDGQAADGGPNLDAGVSEGGPANAYGCFVSVGGSEPKAECSPAGTGSTGAPCVSSADCAAGFACVGDASAAQCRPYCCNQKTDCEPGTYCAERTFRDESGPTTSKVPVCVQADNCDLSEPYPCPPNQQCTCKDGQACAVVRRDGTTSCVTPGKGLAGDECPCAPGHVCAKATNSCLKLCNTQATVSECGSGKCQGASYLPDGYGVCVLTPPDSGKP